MILNHKTILVFCFTLILLFSLTIVSAADNDDSNAISVENSQAKIQSTNPINNEDVIMDEDVNTLKNNADNEKYVYVTNNGNSTSNGSSSSNPTTISNAIRQVENEGTILLMGDSEITYYDISDNIDTDSLKSSVDTFSITAEDNSKIVLNFFSNA